MHLINGKDADKIGYDMQVDYNTLDIQMVKHSDPDKDLPDIEIDTHNNDGIYTFDAKLTYPVLDTNNMSYSDTVEYVMKKWMDIAGFVRRLLEWEYDPEMYYDPE